MGPLTPGFQFRVVVKPFLLSSVWEVTEVRDGESFAWANSSIPGLQLSVDHIAKPAGDMSKVTIKVDIDGPAAPLLATFAGPFMGNFEGSLAALDRMLASEHGVPK